MPRAIDPSYRFPVVLDSDADKPEATRPTFWFRAATAREWGRLLAALDTPGAMAQAEATAAELDVTLVDWRIDKLPFEKGNLLDLVTIVELGQLAKAVVEGGQLSSAEKKQSGSSASCNGDSSAETVTESVSSLLANASPL